MNFLSQQGSTSYPCSNPHRVWQPYFPSILLIPSGQQATFPYLNICLMHSFKRFAREGDVSLTRADATRKSACQRQGWGQTVISLSYHCYSSQESQSSFFTWQPGPGYTVILLSLLGLRQSRAREEHQPHGSQPASQRKQQAGQAIRESF